MSTFCQRYRSRRSRFTGHFALAILVPYTSAAPLAGAEPSAPLRFEIRLEAESADRVDGRLYLFLSQRGGEPMRGPDWFRPEPFFRLDVTDVHSGESRFIDDSAAGFPAELSKTPPGKYRAQAILDHDFYEPRPAEGVGNFYSEPMDVQIGGGRDSQKGTSGNAVSRKVATSLPVIRLTKLVREDPFPDSKWVKEVLVESELLAKFHQRKVIERAAVALPPSYFDDPQRRYPTVFIIPGFGGSHREALRYAAEPAKPAEGEAEFIRVFLSGRCKWGHHVYADSAINGPRGEALVREIIPQIDHEFRTIAEPAARFLTGHSSGGWASLWLQVRYPETFGGVWSSSPDPVDFRDFQRVNLYANPPEDVYRDAKGNRRPIARRGDDPVLWFDSFTKMDDVIGRGGQLRSFEAVFSPRDAAGLPKRLWDRETGRVDPEVGRAWQAYDISLMLKRDWPRLGPLLAGKLHITMGTLDTFYLDGATRRLAERLRDLGSDADVTFVEGANHGSLLTADYFARVRREMSQAFWQRHAK